MHGIDSYCADNETRFIAELAAALRIPSVSADPTFAQRVRESAEHIADAALSAGFSTARVIDTAGHPSVYAERLVDATLPTVLVYGHHDVQPVDPLDEWASPPFEPRVDGGYVYARGAQDDKGQLFVHLKACEAVLRTRGELPVNLKLIVEGEEETGSPHFEALIRDNSEVLRADVLVVSDTSFVALGVPSLCVGLRGVASLEVEVTGPEHDLHSGAFGGTVANPAEELARLLAGLRDPVTRRVTVAGFYDDVRELTAGERVLIDQVPFDEARYREDAGSVPTLVTEQGRSVPEARGARPTLEINGIWGGYSGAGTKTIIPASAGAKVTCRLVPDQDPSDIAHKVRDALVAATPLGVRVDVMTDGLGRPVVTPSDHPAVTAAARAVTAVFGKNPVFTREGGSVPPVEMFARIMGLPAVLLGFGLPGDCIHAPNERFSLDQFRKGVRTVARLWEELAATQPA